MNGLLELAWPVVVAAAGARWCRPPVREVHPRRSRRAPHPTGAPSGLGALARRVCGLPPGSRRSDARLGAGLLLTALAGVTSPPLALVPPVALALRSHRDRRRRVQRTDAEIRAQLPEVTELLALAVGAGCNPLGAVRAVADGLDGPVPDAFGEAVRRVAAGTRLDEALEVVLAELGDPVRPVVDVLRSADRYGTPLLPALRRCGDELRAARRRRAEEAARRVPVRLLLPLCGCVLPAFVLLTFVPLLAGSVTSLGGVP